MAGRTDISLSRTIGARVISTKVLSRRRGPFKKCCALGEDCLERVHLFLRDFTRTMTHGRELDSDESARLGPQVPPWDQITARGLVVDLSSRRQWYIEFGRQMKMKIEVFLWRRAGGFCAG